MIKIDQFLGVSDFIGFVWGERKKKWRIYDKGN